MQWNADGSRDGSVGIATRYGMNGPVIESRWGARFSAPVQTGPGGHPASCTMGTGSFPGVKWPGRGVTQQCRVKFTFTFTFNGWQICLKAVLDAAFD